jgi:SAM-dependent methyltransferase
VDGQLQFDRAAALELETFYKSPMAIERRRRVLSLLDLQAGEAVLDVGAGPGFLSRDLAVQTGSSGRILAIDRSLEMLAHARPRCADQPQVTFLAADAVQIPFSDGTFDAAAAVQVFEYVRELPAALRELHRVLRPGGRAAILDADWGTLVWEADDRARAARIFDAWEEHLEDPHLPRRLAPMLHDAGFEVAAIEPVASVSTVPSSSIAALARLIAAFVPGRRGVTAEDAGAWLADLALREENSRGFFSLTGHLFLAKRA